MHLGQLLNELSDVSTVTEALIKIGDLPLLASISREGEARGLDPATYVTRAVQRYAVQASNEEWITLMGLLNAASDPGASFLRRVLLCAGETSAWNSGRSNPIIEVSVRS